MEEAIPYMVDARQMFHPHSALGSISNHFNTQIYGTSVTEPGPQSLMGVQVQKVDLCKAREALFLRDCQKLEMS